MKTIIELFKIADVYGIMLSIVRQTGGFDIRLDTIDGEATITIEGGRIFAFVIKSVNMDDVIAFTQYYQNIIPLFTDNDDIELDN